MSVRSNRSGWVYTAALSWRVILHRYSFVFFLAFSMGLMVLGHSNPTAVEHVRSRVVDGLSPTLSLLSRPLAMVEGFSGRVQSYRDLLSENQKLRADNANLIRWQNAALAMANENKELRGLLRYKAEPSLSYITARVIADTGGAFVRSLVLTAGRVDGVYEGMAAITGEGLVGRVVEVGEWSSRVLLITDMNSRIPVRVTDTGDHAILAGDNGPEPRLLYLPQDADIKPGARIMTSGHGGLFPPNLPVGVVSHVDRNAASVVPMAVFGRISQIRLIDFKLAGGGFNPMTAKIRAGTSGR